jgi:hypothetical protein
MRPVSSSVWDQIGPSTIPARRAMYDVCSVAHLRAKWPLRAKAVLMHPSSVRDPITHHSTCLRRCAKNKLSYNATSKRSCGGALWGPCSHAATIATTKMHSGRKPCTASPAITLLLCGIKSIRVERLNRAITSRGQLVP